MKTIALYSVKGGVGKTTCAVNLAFFAAQRGRRVLLMDMDPQGAAGYTFRVRPPKGLKGKHVFSRKGCIRENIRESDYPKLDVFAATRGFRKFDLALDDAKHPEKGLERALSDLQDEYDIVVIDAPPGMSLLAENLVATATLLVTPTIPTPLSERALEQVFDFAAKRRPKDLPIGAYFSMVDRRRSLHRETMTRLREQFNCFLKQSIPYSSRVERMALEREPLLMSRSRRNPVEAFRRLCREILGRLG